MRRAGAEDTEDTAKKTAGDENVELLVAAGKSDVDNDSQVAALEDMTEPGSQGHPHHPRQLGGRRAGDRKGASGRRDRDRSRHADRPESAVDALFATNTLRRAS